MKKITLATLLILLTACSAVKVPSKNKFSLDRVSHEKLQKLPRHVTIEVAGVRAAPVYQTSDMIYVDKSYEVKAFAYNEWAAPPAEMLTPLVVESLRNSGAFFEIVPPLTTGKADYRLSVEILSLQQQFTVIPAQVEVVLTAQLYDFKTRRPIASHRIEVRMESLTNDPYGGVLAANRAVQQALQELTEFCRSAIRA